MNGKNKIIAILLMLSILSVASLSIYRVNAETNILWVENWENGIGDWAKAGLYDYLGEMSQPAVITTDWATDGTHSLRFDQGDFLAKNFANPRPTDTIYAWGWLRYSKIQAVFSWDGPIFELRTDNGFSVFGFPTIKSYYPAYGQFWNFTLVYFDMYTHNVGNFVPSNKFALPDNIYFVVFSYSHTLTTITEKLWINQTIMGMPDAEITVNDSHNYVFDNMFAGSVKSGGLSSDSYGYLDEIGVGYNYPISSPPLPPPPPEPDPEPEPIIPPTIIGNDVLTIESNSTVSEVNIQSKYGIIDFTVSGQTGTTGYVNVIISKTIVSDMYTIQTFVDGISTSSIISENSTSVFIHLAYSHSTHAIKLTFAPNESINTIPELVPKDIFFLMVLAIFAVAVVFLLLKRKHK